MNYFAICVTNTWTKKQYLRPDILNYEQAAKEKERLLANCSQTGNIKNNEYKIIEIL